MAFVLDGREFASKTAAAVALVAEGKSVKEAAATVGITYQTVYVNTKGKNTRQLWNMKHRRKSQKSNENECGRKEIANQRSATTGEVNGVMQKILGYIRPSVIDEMAIADTTTEAVAVA